MSPREVTLMAVLLALGIPGLTAAQGLGDAAARERERRAKDKNAKQDEAGPSFTNFDLDAISPPEDEEESESESVESSSGTSAARRETAQPRRSGGVRGRDDALRSHRDEVSQAQAQVDGIEARIRELNAKLNPMSRDYIYGAAQSGNAAGEELRVRAELNELEEQLADARRDLAAATEAMNAAQQGRQPSFTSAEPQ